MKLNSCWNSPLVRAEPKYTFVTSQGVQDKDKGSRTEKIQQRFGDLSKTGSVPTLLLNNCLFMPSLDFFWGPINAFKNLALSNIHLTAVANNNILSARFNQLLLAIPDILKMLLLMMMVFTPALLVQATSVKMDFLSAGLVRTDPLMYSQIGECLSDHVHRFYGAVSNKTMRPEVSYEDLRDADGNSGNVEENLSLYWNPAIYKVKNQYSEDKTYEIVDVWFASAYYVWHTGKTFAFPRGLKMRALGENKQSRAVRMCDGAFDCERQDEDGCEGYLPSQQVDRMITLKSDFFL